MLCQGIEQKQAGWREDVLHRRNKSLGWFSQGNGKCCEVEGCCVWLLGYLGIDFQGRSTPLDSLIWICQSSKWTFSEKGTPATWTAPFLREPGPHLSIAAAVSHPSVTVRNDLGSSNVYSHSIIFCNPALFSITFVDLYHSE